MKLYSRIIRWLKARPAKFLLLPVANGCCYARFLGVGVGEGCRLFISEFGSEPYLINIGSNTTISGDVKLLTHGGSGALACDEDGRRYDFGKIDIGSNCFIGHSAIVLPGITIGDRVIVAAGALVTKNIESGVVVAGNPARDISSTDAYVERILSTGMSDRDFKKYSNRKDAVLAFVQNKTLRNEN